MNIPTVLAAITLSSILSQGTTAAPVVSGHGLVIGEWHFHAIVDEADVHSVLACRERDRVVGDNVSAVLFERQATSWTTVGWVGAEAGGWNAASWLKQHHAMPDSSDHRWAIPGSPDLDIPSPEPPVSLVAGVLAGDPFGPVLLAMDHPEPLLALLAAGGWSASTLGLDMVALGLDCDVVELVAQFEAAVEAANAGGDFARELSSLLSESACTAALCWPWTGHRPPTPWSAWTCGGWVPDPNFPWPTASTTCSVNFHFRRPTSRSQTRSCFSIGVDCSVTETWTETRTQVAEQTARCTVDLLQWDCRIPVPFPPGSVPAAPCSAGSSVCVPTTAPDTGPWS